MLRPHTTSAASIWLGSDDVHRATYRVFCVLAGLLSPVFGVFYNTVFPGSVDPLWGRLGLSVVALLLLSLSYMNRWVERNFVGLVRGYFSLLMVYIVGITTANGFSYPYALGLLFAFMAMGVAFSLGLSSRIAPLLYFLGLTLVAMVVGGVVVDEPGAHVWLVGICAFSTALIIVVVADAKMRADAATRASDHRYRTLLDAASDAILIADLASGQLVDANRKAQEFLGRSLDEIRQTSIAELFPEEGRSEALAAFEARVRDGDGPTGDVFLVAAGLEVLPVDLSASLVTIDGRTYVQAIFRRHRYEEQLVQAKERAEELLRLKTSLLNNMSHELRTPLTAILGFAEILMEEAAGEARELAGIVRDSAQRLFDTVTSVLGLAHLESGATALDLKAVPAEPSVRRAIEELRPLAEQKGIGLRLEAGALPEGAALLADEVCLGRVLTNLVGNAIKFTECGEVFVRLEADDRSVTLDVCDTGIGISEAFLPRVFEEFQQESTGFDRSHEGTGLGLAITKRLLDLMGGGISVESRKGAGTVFSVVLPRAELGPASPAVPHLSLGPTGRRVLYVEDNEAMRRLVTNRLAPYCEVVAEGDPRAALARAASEPFDALLLDINLTDVQDGVALLRAIRRLPGRSGTPAVALTAYALPGAEGRFRAAGFDHYLAKPFRTDQLLDLLPALFPECAPAEVGRSGGGRPVLIG